MGLTYVRGCEIEGMLDQNGRVIEEGPEPKPQLQGEKRTFRVWLDCNQYRTDMDLASQGKEVCMCMCMCVWLDCNMYHTDMDLVSQGKEVCMCGWIVTSIVLRGRRYICVCVNHCTFTTTQMCCSSVY